MRINTINTLSAFENIIRFVLLKISLIAVLKAPFIFNGTCQVAIFNGTLSLNVSIKSSSSLSNQGVWQI